MPNWAYTMYHATGDKEQLRKLHFVMDELECMKAPGLHDNGTVSFSVESAWGELNEVREFIEGKFPGVKLYFQCEESGNGVYETNDDTGEYFPERYYLWVEGSDSLYHETLEGLINDVENITGSKNLKTLDSLRKALESYSRKNHDLCYTLEEFSVVND